MAPLLSPGDTDGLFCLECGTAFCFDSNLHQHYTEHARKACLTKLPDKTKTKTLQIVDLCLVVELLSDLKLKSSLNICFRWIYGLLGSMMEGRYLYIEYFLG